MEIEPLDPRQGPVKDLVDPTFTDKTLPDTNPNVQQPRISPLLHDPALRPELIPRVAPGQYKSGSTGVIKT